MKSSCFLKTFSVITAAILTVCSIAPCSARCDNSPSLKIEQVEIEDPAANGGSVAVDVSISGNTGGFLATSFGIQYDTALTLTEVVCLNTVGSAHSAFSNPERSLIWFSGAAGTADSTISHEAEETMFTLYFTLPEDAAPDCNYPISFCWTMANGKQGYWHTGDRTNILGNLQSSAKNGGISIPNANAPKLSQTELHLKVGEEQTLSILNYDNTVAWVSDNPAVADVNEGVVRAVSPGSCNIYAAFNSSFLICPVTVTNETSYDITQTDVIYIRDPNQTVVVEYPTSEGTVTWISDNTSVVTVNNGYLTGIQNGTATVYAICGETISTVQVIVEFGDTEPTTESTEPTTEPTEPTTEPTEPTTEPTESTTEPTEPTTEPTEPTTEPTEPSTDETETSMDDDTYGNGDVTQDGKINILDVISLNRNLLTGETLNDQQRNAADVDCNASINPADSLIILKYIISLVPSLPLEG